MRKTYNPSTNTHSFLLAELRSEGGLDLAGGLLYLGVGEVDVHLLFLRLGSLGVQFPHLVVQFLFGFVNHRLVFSYAVSAECGLDFGCRSHQLGVAEVDLFLRSRHAQLLLLLLLLLVLLPGLVAPEGSLDLGGGGSELSVLCRPSTRH